MHGAGAAAGFPFAARLAELAAADLLRARLERDGAQGAEVVLDGRRCVNFSSNDYLGLAADPRVIQALKEGADLHGAGSGAAAVMTGWTRAHARLEEALADFTGRERALLFCSGYMANLALGLSGLVSRGDLVLEDRLNHASLIDAARISGARLRRYPHLDAVAAARALAMAPPRRALVLTDGVFSMDGDIAPVPALAQACAAARALLVVDDAHGIGVLGHRGGGTLEACAASPAQVPFLVGTLGKALGTAGAFIAGAHDAVEYLAQCARTHLFTTAPPPALAHATLRALGIAATEAWRRERLQVLVDRLRTGAGQLGLALLPSTTPIQGLVLGTPARALAVSAALRDRGLLVHAVRPPTVPRGTARLRITLSAMHADAHVDRLLEELARALAPVPRP